MLCLAVLCLASCSEAAPSVERHARLEPGVALELGAYLDRSPTWCALPPVARVGPEGSEQRFAHLTDARVRGDAAACEPTPLPGAPGGVTCLLDPATGAFALRASIGVADGRAARADVASEQLAAIHASLRVNVPELPAWDAMEEQRFGTSSDRDSGLWFLMLLGLMLLIGATIAVFVVIGLAAGRRSNPPEPRLPPIGGRREGWFSDAAAYPPSHGDDRSADVPPRER